MSKEFYPVATASFGAHKTIVESWCDELDDDLTTVGVETAASPRWAYMLDRDSVGPSPAPSLTHQAPDTDCELNANYLRYTGSSGAGSLISWIKTARPIGRASSTSHAEIRASLRVRVVAAAGLSVSLALSPDSGALNTAQISCANGSTWQTLVQHDGSTLLSEDTGVPLRGGWLTLSAIYSGAESDEGLRAGGGLFKFLVDGRVVSQVSAGSFADLLRVVINIGSTVHSPAPEVHLGPVEIFSTW